ncbi:hypothetical protein DPX16_13504 [Anabarilius grahami]|uniref:Uncharacterized protein n=1 Tax=Anabarilius grahami TaxID=495550 RepID=A0A3N0YBF0_ANAGA|nr:hypothetical protein DPX16_13504 [Anabarilius grahami]
MFVCSRDFSDEYFVNKSQFGPGFADQGASRHRRSCALFSSAHGTDGRYASRISAFSGKTRFSVSIFYKYDKTKDLSEK